MMIKPQNITAQLHYRARGNPPNSQPVSAISNCFPGLEMDFRAIWRRMFDEIGHSVIKLVRTRIGKLEVEPMKVGQWRYLTAREVRQLKSVGRTKTTPRVTPPTSSTRMRTRRH